MKTFAITVLVACFSIPVVLPAQKADGYAYREYEMFSPGVYEATVDARVYFDIDTKAAHEDLRIKKGTRINVYSAGHHGAQPPSMDWLILGEDCNGAILPWETFGWTGALAKDFRRVGELHSPIYKNGVVTNCAPTNAVLPVAGTRSSTPR